MKFHLFLLVVHMDQIPEVVNSTAGCSIRGIRKGQTPAPSLSSLQYD